MSGVRISSSTLFLYACIRFLSLILSQTKTFVYLIPITLIYPNYNYSLYLERVEDAIKKEQPINKLNLLTQSVPGKKKRNAQKNNLHIPDGSRTHNLRLRRATPYPLGHRDKIKKDERKKVCQTGETFLSITNFANYFIRFYPTEKEGGKKFYLS